MTGCAGVPVIESSGVVLRLHPSTFADPIPAGVTLRDEMRYAARLSGGKQMIRPLRAQPVGGGEPPVHAPHIGLGGYRGHLMYDDVRPGLAHRLSDRSRIQTVHHYGIRTQIL